MQVKDLIKELEKQDPESMVVVRAYEDGVNEVTSISPVTVTPSFTDKWYYGEYNIDIKGTVAAVFIGNN